MTRIDRESGSDKSQVWIDGVDPQTAGTIVEFEGDLDEKVIAKKVERDGTKMRVLYEIKGRGEMWTEWMDTAKIPKWGDE